MASTDKVGLHLKNIFANGELQEKATTEDFSVVRIEGGRRQRRRLRHYSLDAIISVGYRVNSKRKSDHSDTREDRPTTTMVNVVRGQWSPKYW